MGTKASDNYAHTLKYVSKSCNTNRVCDKAVDTYPSPTNLFLNVIRLKIYVIE